MLHFWVFCGTDEAEGFQKEEMLSIHVLFLMNWMKSDSEMFVKHVATICLTLGRQQETVLLKRSNRLLQREPL